jgi:hypothetical protein
MICDPVSVHDELQTERFLLAIWLIFDREARGDRKKMGGNWPGKWDARVKEGNEQTGDVLKVQSKAKVRYAQG